MTSHLTTGFAITALGALVATAACKGETKTKDSAETLQRLSDVEAALTDKNKLVEKLNARVTEMQMEAGTVVVSMEGPRKNGEPGAILAIKGRGPNSRGSKPDPKGDAKDRELYEAFVSKVRGSRGSIKKCYENALKKRSDLQTRPITVTISVDYRTNGVVRGSRFKPQITNEFNSCMSSVATRWKLPAMPKAVAFSYRQRLTPQ